MIAAAQDPHEFTFGTDMMAWTLAMGHAMIRAGLSLKQPGSDRAWRPDVVHAHDWLVAHPAIALAEFYDVPMVSTIHATEAGRHSGWVSGAISRQVHAVESWLVRESDSLITCSASMSDEITELFGPGLAEITVIRNGIDAARWPFALRRPRTGPPELLYLGRLEYEKGVHDAIAALPRIRRAHPGTTLTIAGEGTQQDWLVEQARKHKVLKATRFVGHLDHAELLAVLHRADAAVLPSHYEPFGIVALEAAAAGTPLVTSNIGGLGEAVINGADRDVVPASRRGGGWPPRCARCSTTRPAAQRRARAARKRLTSDFDWHTVADGDRAGVSGGQARRTPTACRGCPSSSTRCRIASAPAFGEIRRYRQRHGARVFERRSTHRIDEVFDWHARPGAFTRLSPPWQPMRLVTEADSLKDGRATLALPGWSALGRRTSAGRL